MQKLDREELRQTQLDILKKVAQFCEKHHLTYSLCGGTFLGAIRHKGFIPWDDDIDLMMPRPDYEKFRKIFEYKGLELSCYERTKSYAFPFIKISDMHTQMYMGDRKEKGIGVNIDIFPIDGFPDEKEDMTKQIRKIAWLRTILINYFFHKKLFRRPFRLKIFVEVLITKLFMAFFSVKGLLRLINKMSKKYKFGETSKAGIAVWGYGFKEVCPTTIYEETKEIIFENEKFKAIKDYDTYLSKVYGDYMKIPPEKERIRHGYSYYWKKTIAS